MSLLEKQLYLKKSGLPNAGKGLFTKQEIPKGTVIVEYKGRIYTWDQIKHEDGTNAYLYYVNSKRVINARHNLKALARYANDAKGWSRTAGLRNNSEYIEKNKRCFIKCTRRILKGGEIFVGYGREYWEMMKKTHPPKKKK
ncbi:MAG: SET domain-containing protein [Bacteroidota bacterium]